MSWDARKRGGSYGNQILLKDTKEKRLASPGGHSETEVNYSGMPSMSYRIGNSF